MQKILETKKDLYWAPPGSEIRVVKDDQLPPEDLTVTVHALCFQADKILMALHPERGWDVPGGHVEPGESLEDALIRETHEEAGALICNIRPIGHLRLLISAPNPDGWEYPYPAGYLLFFYADFDGFYQSKLHHETVESKLFTPSEAAKLPWIKEWQCLYQLGMSESIKAMDKCNINKST